MKILLSGASGFIGSALVAKLASEGHELVRLVRAEPKPGEPEIRWDPAAGRLDPASVEGFDAVVHLAGENIAEGRWTEAKKTRIRESRVRGTELVARTLARLANRPDVLVSASAIGFYGDRGDAELDEGSSRGSGFLCEVCRQWEGASRLAGDAGIRVVQLRTGLVLSASGGGLARMLPMFQLGLGGPLGSGRQYVSWITRDDLVAAVRHVLVTDTLQGPVNAVAPQPVTNREFTRALGRALHRPACVPVPGFVLRAALGEMADELLLASTRVLPRRLLQTGFRFGDGDLQAALRRLLTGG
jgi:hypothetical protein